MKPRGPFPSYALLAVVWLGFAAYVWFTSGQLPERVATHFGPRGEPNGWETHASYLRFTLFLGFGVPALIVGIFSLLPIGNGALMNIPHKDYWLAPERRAETLVFVQRQGMWLAGTLIVFFGAIHWFILRANSQAPANLPLSFALWAAGILVASVAVLMGSFIRHFYRQRT